MDAGHVLATGTARVDEVTQRFGLVEVIDVLPDPLPLSQRQPLSLAVARDAFWRAVIEKRGAETLEDAVAESGTDDVGLKARAPAEASEPSGHGLRRRFNPRRVFSYARREALELRRDPIRAPLALLGSVIPISVMGYGITMDVEDLSFAVLDRDEPRLHAQSRGLALLQAPTTHFVMLAQAILYRGAGLAVVWPQFIALAVIGSALFGYALARFRSTIGTMA